MSNNWTLDHSSMKVFKGNPLEGDVFAQVMEMNSGYLVSSFHFRFAGPCVFIRIKNLSIYSMPARIGIGSKKLV